MLGMDARPRPATERKQMMESANQRELMDAKKKILHLEASVMALETMFRQELLKNIKLTV